MKASKEKELVMTVQNNISPRLRAHFEKMVADGAIMESDFAAFLRSPGKWREGSAMAPIIESAQPFWRGVWDELLEQGKVTVPPVPKLTEKQVKSMEHFGFLPMYLPALTEDQYPTGFVKLNWNLDASQVERKLLTGQWVAVETIRKPAWDDPAGYPDDRLMAAVKKQSRFNTPWDDLTNSLLAEIAKTTGFPKKGTRLPSAEEWNLVGNLFNWLRGHRSMPHLPDLGSTRSVEWCGNADGSESRLVVGDVGLGGLAYVCSFWPGRRSGYTAFRVLVVL